jgi:aspartate carbamoyltransferase catalytic subunit
MPAATTKMAAPPRLAGPPSLRGGGRPRLATARPVARPRAAAAGPASSSSIAATGGEARHPSIAGDWADLPIRHVVESQQFSRASLDMIFDTAEAMERVQPGSPESRALAGCVMSTLFYEPSTRTRLSFEAAMARLGGTVLSTESAGEYSSAAKGETLEGTSERLAWNSCGVWGVCV